MATTLDWYGCATFRLRTAGLMIFLDAYIDRVPGAGPIENHRRHRAGAFDSDHPL